MVAQSWCKQRTIEKRPARVACRHTVYSNPGKLDCVKTIVKTKNYFHLMRVNTNKYKQTTSNNFIIHMICAMLNYGFL